tara:strand:+ start:324 stop:3695 length:3372 start_codon:yes stop_codon:yes gene_type:complete
MEKVSTFSKYTLLGVFLAFYTVTAQNYADSDGRVIWDQAANAGYNYNVTGIGQDNASKLNQKQSKTLNTAEDITIGIKEIAATNSANVYSFFGDKTFLMWGHNNGATVATTGITKDFGAATGVTTSVSVTPIARIWKIVNSDSVPTIKLSIPESMVSSTNPGGEEYIMIIADDDSFTTNVTSATMKGVGAELEVDFYFEGTKYITFGSTAITAEMPRAVSFDRTDMYLTAGDVNDLANTDYTISAWVKRDASDENFDIISKRNYYNENTNLDSGSDANGNYTHGYAFRINKDNKFMMVWRDPEDTTNNILQTSATIPENEWHHIAATFNAANNMTSLYVDGHLEARDDTLDPINIPSDAHFMIGAAHHIKRQQKFGGSIDEVRIWNVTLSEDQIRYIMNQEIEENAALNTDGEILPSSITKNDMASMPWNNLIAYYPMNRFVFGSVKDESNSRNDASMINYDSVDAQTAPLPYQTAQDGNWDDETTWVNGDVQYLPGTNSYLSALETIDHNIVQINHNVTLDNSDTSLIPTDSNGNRTVLGLIVDSGELQIDGDTATNSGNSITVSHYLKLNGKIDLEGESQLIQTTGSDLDTSSSGSLERDQQGTKDLYTYNYWSSPVGLINTSTNNTAFSFTNNILKNGTISSNPGNITFLTSGYNGSITGTDINVADYWIWKYGSQLSNDYSSWQHLRSTGTINVGEGFTMKGVESSGTSFTSTQNYVFDGKPNNGDITIPIKAGNDYLVGNPYPSALDANEFIKDNISNLETNGRNTNGNIINGTLYFWDHFASGTHIVPEYNGGYATYTLMGGAVAVNNDTRMNVTGTSGAKVPGRYIPVGQGFFVSAILDTDLIEGSNNSALTETIDGGYLLFKNSQRVFEKEGEASSIFLKQNNVQKGDNRQKIRLMLDSPKGYHRQLLVGVDENCTNAFDIGYDAPLIEDNKEDMFWVFDNNKYIIQAVNSFDPEQNLALGIKIDKEGLASIKIDDLENIAVNSNIYLYDKGLDIYHDLKTDNYDVYLTVGEHLNRFELTFTNTSKLALSVEEKLNKNLQVYFSNEKESVIVHNPTLITIENVAIYNILGQPIYQFTIDEIENYFELKTNQVKTGVYIINMKTENDIMSKKVLIE